MKCRPPTLLFILLLVVVGAIVNIAVAWGCCMYGYRDPRSGVTARHDPSPEDLQWWRSVDPPAGVGEPTFIWPVRLVGYWETRYVGHGPIFTPTGSGGSGGTGGAVAGVVGAPGARAGQPYEITSSANWNEAGWPLRSMRGIWFGIPDMTTGKWTNQTRGAWKLSPTFMTQAFPKRAAYLPLRPRWPAFAINTAFYGCILWLFFAAPFALRKRRRIKRGLCPKCAYDLRGSVNDSVCPECGAAVTPRAKA